MSFSTQRASEWYWAPLLYVYSIHSYYQDFSVSGMIHQISDSIFIWISEWFSISKQNTAITMPLKNTNNAKRQLRPYHVFLFKNAAFLLQREMMNTGHKLSCLWAAQNVRPPNCLSRVPVALIWMWESTVLACLLKHCYANLSVVYFGTKTCSTAQSKQKKCSFCDFFCHQWT